VLAAAGLLAPLTDFSRGLFPVSCDEIRRVENAENRKRRETTIYGLIKNTQSKKAGMTQW